MQRGVSVQSSKSSLAALTLGAIGVVYGDIGTSVLYAVKEVFGSGHVPFTPDNIYGILSIFFWTLTVIVSLKYVVLVLRADNNGEGGLIAMLALASQAVKDKPRLRKVLLAVGIFGTSLFYGDGVITPAISVLSAVEGLEVVSPHFKQYVIPLTLVVLFCLFAVQKRGTSGIGKFFGPVTLIWFLTIAVLGVSHIVTHPEILWAMSPHHAVGFMWAHPGISFIILGAVVLCVTGAEALYADLGHFGKRPIRLAWFGVAMPALTLNYFGQGALLLAEPEAVKNPFFMMAPDWALVPLVVMATLATVIASQALITGAFSVTKQVIQLGYLPRLNILHTSVRDTGQIYIPLVNWGLFVAIVLAVVMFRSSSNLAAAYGIAVTLDMLITTTLTFFVIRYGWGYPLALCIAATGCFFAVDLAFFASNLLKLFQGGWFPLMIGGIVFSLMMTWKEGRRLLNHKLRADAIDLKDFLWEGMILREKDFRDKVAAINPEDYRECYVYIYNSADAIVPLWAYFLLTAKITDEAKKIVFGNREDLEVLLMHNAVQTYDFTKLTDKRVLVKGCSDVNIPENAYIELVEQLKPLVKSLMFGEACSNVPIFKN